MSHIDHHVSVTCPLAQSGMRLKQFFREHGNRDGDTARLSLGIDVDVPGLHVPLTLERSVIATIQPHHVSGDMEPRYNVQWAPELPGPFPLFAGELVVEGGSDYDSFTLRLRGDYTPPLGFVGKTFDVALGNRIAAGTAQTLLASIRTTVERNFREDEDRKRGDDRCAT